MQSWWALFLVLHTSIFCSSKCNKDACKKPEGSHRALIYCAGVVLGKELDAVGYVKKLYHAEVENVLVVVSFPRFDFLKEDFLHGLTMLAAFQGNPNVVELIGYCNRWEDLQLITKYLRHGSPENLDKVLSDLRLTSEVEFQVRLSMVLDYVSIIAFLHDSPLGTRVMCDSNSLNKTLSQYLITDELRLVVNDLDALPQVNEGNQYKIKCGNRQLFGDFVAPEQLWPHLDRPFNNSEMEGYSEKIDIWKIPSVLLNLLGTSIYSTQLKLRLFSLFSRCRSIDPAKRPSAKEVLDEIKVLSARETNFKVEF